MIVKFDEKGLNHACEVDKKVSNDIPNTKRWFCYGKQHIYLSDTLIINESSNTYNNSTIHTFNYKSYVPSPPSLRGNL